MKRLKMILTAAAIFTVVGGALAFKAPSTNGNLLCADTQFAPCPTDQTYSPLSGGAAKFCREINASGTCDTPTEVKIDQ